MNHFEKVFQCFPQSIQRQFDGLDRRTKENLEEIRVYKGREVQVFAEGQRTALLGKIDGGDIHNLLNNLMKFSYYAYEEDLARGVYHHRRRPSSRNLRKGRQRSGKNHPYP